MTVMAPPSGPPKKPYRPSMLELQLEIEYQLQVRSAARDSARQQFGEPTEVRDKEVRRLELLAEIIYTISLDTDRYREFALDMRAKYPRWVPPAERGIQEKTEEPGATEE